MDLVVGGRGTRLLAGNGRGNFTLTATYAEGENALSDSATGDFNRDGKMDLAITMTQSGESHVEVLFGSGNGAMVRSASFACGYGAGGIVASDLDADGNTDLVVTAGLAPAVFRGHENGAFEGPQFFAVGGAAGSRALAADFDWDGVQDLMIGSSEPTLLHGIGFCRFAAYRAFRTHTNTFDKLPGLGTTSDAIADLNNDGHPDLVVTRRQVAVTSGPYDVVVMLNDGTGGLGRPIATTVGTISSYPIPAPPVAVADLNGDGNADVVATSPQGAVLLGRGDGTFAPPVTFAVASSGAPALGKFDGDATLDLLVPGGTFVTVYPGNGDGTFRVGIRSDVDAQSVFTGDLTGDGVADYVSSTTQRTVVCVNDGAGHFTATVLTTQWQAATALADFNGDGALDLLFGLTEVWLGGGGTFVAPRAFTASGSWDVVRDGPLLTADFDGDGNLDVTAATAIYVGNGDGTFRSRARFGYGAYSGVGAGDMDGNGSLDLVVTSSSSDEVEVLLTMTTPDPTAELSTSLTASKTSAVYGEAVTFTATISGGPVLTGAVLFEIDGVDRALVGVDWSNPVVEFKPGLEVGSHTVTATYTGDDRYRSASQSVNVAASKAPSSTSVNGSPSSQAVGGTVKITASTYQRVPAGFSAPTGRFTIHDGSTVLGEVKNGGSN
jgi:hypothetical protein